MCTYILDISEKLQTPLSPSTRRISSMSMFNRSASVGSNLGVSSPGREKSPAKEHIPNLGLLFNYPQFPSKCKDKTLFTAHGVFQMVQISKNYQRKIVNIFLSIHFNICFGFSKEPSQWDGSFEYPQHMFWLRNKKINFWLHTLIRRSGWSLISSQTLLILFSFSNLGMPSVGREKSPAKEYITNLGLTVQLPTISKL